MKHLTFEEVNGLSMTMSMEGEEYYRELSLSKRTEMHGIGSTRLNSDVPVPYFSFEEYDIQALPPAHQIEAALFLAKNCNSRSGREQLVRELQARGHVVSPSSCLKNKNLPFSDLRDKVSLMRKKVRTLPFVREPEGG